ncbi:hypothetical protein LTR16_003228, partial [Cryomyces antarcticus]
MAAELPEKEEERSAEAGPKTPIKQHHPTNTEQDTSEDHGTEDEEDGEDEDDEPKLKYTRLTGSLGSVYRNGDATSSFVVGGDKM